VKTSHSSDPVTIAAAAMSRRAALGRLAAGGVAVSLLTAAGRPVVRAQGTPRTRAEDGLEPNRFVLAGADTRISYVEANDAGESVLTYDGRYGSQTFVGDALAKEENALGRPITVFLGAFPDQGEFWLTLLLPRFNPMRAGDAPVPFATLAIETGHISTIAGPLSPPARYSVLPLEGTAEFVVF
jgi:hypothetical protein